MTLYGKFTVGIASISEAAGLTLNQQACAGEPVEFTLDPAPLQLTERQPIPMTLDTNGSELQLRTIRSRG